MTNDKIVEVLQDFEIDIFYRDVSIDEVNKYNYFVYYETSMREENCKFYQNIEIVYVSENQSNTNYFEIDIINKMKSIGLKFIGAEYDSFLKDNTDGYVDTIVFTFSRPVIRK